MTVQCKTVLYPVRDIEGTKALFAELFGAAPHVDSPYYVGFSVNGSEIGLVPRGHDQGMSGPIAYYDVEDIAGTIDALVTKGATLVQEPTDVGAGLLVAKVRDADGNDVGLRQMPASS